MKKEFKYFNIIFLFLIIFYIKPINKYKYVYDYIIDNSYITTIPNIKKNSLDVFYGNITAYVSYCDGCIGITASGYDVNNTIYYYDNIYGKVRIVAADKSIPFGTIIKISNIGEDIIAIVLDRGSAIGFNNFSSIDLLCANEIISYQFGNKSNAKIEVLRYGF